MAKKPTITTVTTGYTSQETINNNFEALRDAFDNTVSRDGSLPNTMEADLDMEGNDLLNVGLLSATEFKVAGEDFTVSVNSAQEYAQQAAISAAQAALYSRIDFETVVGLLSDTAMTYTPDVEGSIFAGQYLSVLGDGFTYQIADESATDNHVVTAGGVKLYIVDVGVSPAHFGAIEGVTTDYSAEIQLAFDLVMASWNADKWSFDKFVDFKGKTYRADSSINCSGIRQPRLTITNGQIFSKAAGLIGLDLALTNSPIIEDFLIYGEETAPPAWGWYFGRALLNGGYPGVDGLSIRGRSGAWGFFSRGAALMFAAEVTNHDNRTIWHNRHRSLQAVSLACVDTMGAIFRQFGSDTESEFQTLPTTATGSHSNVCHDFNQTEIRRVADYNLSVVSITKAAQAVVTVATGTLAAENIQIGDFVFVTGGNMTELAYDSYEVVALGTDTLTLDVNSTAFTTYTSGATLQNKTGAGLLSSGMRTVSASGSYILTYGAPCILIDGQGGAPYDWDIQVQFERHSDKPVTFLIPSGTIVVPHLRISATNTSQSPKTAVIWIEGAGNLRLDSGYLKISNMATAPAQSVLAPQAQFNARNFDIEVPLSASLPLVSSMLEYSGKMVAQNRDPKITQHAVAFRELRSLEMNGYGTALTKAGIRWQNDSYFGYRELAGAERRFQVQDAATLVQFNAIGDRVNTSDKYAGKMVWATALSKPVWAVGGTAGSVWVDATGATVYTPV